MPGHTPYKQLQHPLGPNCLDVIVFHSGIICIVKETLQRRTSKCGPEDWQDGYSHALFDTLCLKRNAEPALKNGFTNKNTGVCFLETQGLHSHRTTAAQIQGLQLIFEECVLSMGFIIEIVCVQAFMPARTLDSFEFGPLVKTKQS